MVLVSILDNGGETFDRYTISFLDPDAGDSMCYGSSEDPFHPQGFGMYCGDYCFPDTDENPKIGLPVTWDDVPESVQRLIIQIEKGI